MSAGIAALLPDEHHREIFERADKALYEAKARGRNQTAVSDWQ
ncbi:MAG: diguanylate cyclase [Marinobacter sp.]|nr:diguanylate cyclase [Marinobacter sp.]